jgi:putative transposase
LSLFYFPNFYYTRFEVMKLPRYVRDISKNGIYHFILRGINRQVIFEDDEDIQRLLETIVRFK